MSNTQPNKKITAKGLYPDSWEQYEDGSAGAVCTLCGEFKVMPAETFAKFSKIPRGFEHWSKFYTCTDCFIHSKEAGKRASGAARKDETQDRISYAQSWNLAATMVAPLTDAKHEQKKELLETWQEYFHQKLINH